MQRLDGLRIRAVKLMPSVAPHVHQAHVAQHAQVLGDGRLVELDQRNDIADRELLDHQQTENLPAPGFRHRVEYIRSCRGPRHEENITFPYGNMSSPVDNMSSAVALHWSQFFRRLEPELAHPRRLLARWPCVGLRGAQGT